MNNTTVNVTGVPGMANGRATATLSDAWFDQEQTAQVLHWVKRIERLQHKAAGRLHEASAGLDDALQGHPLEQRLRQGLLQPLQEDCAALAALFERVHTRLSLFAPAQTQAQFERGLELQLADLQDAQEPDPEEDTDAVAAASLPFGYWLSEDSFNCIERAASAIDLLACISDDMPVNFDAVASTAGYIHDGLKAVVADARHTSQLGRDDARG